MAGEVEPGGLWGHCEQAAEMVAHGGDEGGLALCCEVANAAKMAREVAFGDEIGEDRLFERRWVAIGEDARGDDRRGEVGRGDDVADAQPRREDLAEGAEVDDSSGGIEDRKSVV